MESDEELSLPRSMTKGSEAQSQRERNKRVRRNAVCGVLGVEKGNGCRKMCAARSSRISPGMCVEDRSRCEAVHFLRRRIVGESAG